MWLRPWTMQVPTAWRASRAPEAPKPEFDPNSIFQSLSNLTSGGHTGNLYSDLERFGDVLGFVWDGFLKKWFFDRNFFIFFSDIFWFFKKKYEKSRKSRKSDFLKFQNLQTVGPCMVHGCSHIKTSPCPFSACKYPQVAQITLKTSEMERGGNSASKLCKKNLRSEKKIELEKKFWFFSEMWSFSNDTVSNPIRAFTVKRAEITLFRTS